MLPNLVMNMRAGTSAGASRIRNHLSLFDLLPDTDRDLRIMTIQCGQSIAVIHLHQDSISPSRSALGDAAIRRCHYGRSRMNGYIDARMQFTAIAKRRCAPAES